MKGRTYGDAALVMTDDDDVATALEDLSAGRRFEVEGRTVELAEDVEFGHKFALVDLAAGDQVRKYGEVIGRATRPIATGEWVHTHNVESARARPDSDEGAGASTTDNGTPSSSETPEGRR